MRAATVSQRALALVARELDLGSYVLLGKGELSHGRAGQGLDPVRHARGGVRGGLPEPRRRDRPRGGRAARRPVARRRGGPRCRPGLEDVAAGAVRGPRPRCARATTSTGEGPDHSRTFTARAIVAGEPRGVGVGPAKKLAEQDAAADAYRVLAAQAAALTCPSCPRSRPSATGWRGTCWAARSTGVEVRRDYSVRRHVDGPLDFAGRLRGRRLDAAVRRGKFLWLLLDEDDDALMAHLGMSGQLLVRERGPGASGAPAPARPARPRRRLRPGLRRPAHVRAPERPGPRPDAGRCTGRARLAACRSCPEPVAHIARDLLDPVLDRDGARRGGPSAQDRHQARAARPDASCPGSATSTPTRASGGRSCTTRGRRRRCAGAEVERALDGAAEVMTEALVQGGTSFDALYVNVNGASGYFDRSLAVYGQEGRPCPRCGTPVRRDEFMNRSSYSCPRCQPRPRRGRF